MFVRLLNLSNVEHNLPVGSRLNPFWEPWKPWGAVPKTKLDKVTKNPSAYEQDAVEPVPNLWASSADLSWFQTTQPLETYSRSGQTKPFGDHQDLPPTRGVGYLSRFQGCLLPYTYTGTIQEIPEISHPGSGIPIPCPAIWCAHSTHGVHCATKGGETDGYTQGFKNPPVPRLVGESQIPPGLSPTYTGTRKNVSAIGLAGELREIRAGAQTRLRFCRLPVRPQIWSGPTDSGPVAEPSRENNETAIPTGLPGPGIHALDRFTNSYRKASSSRPASYKTHSVASLEGTRITKKGDPNPQVPAPPLTMVAEGRQCTYRPTITPNITCSSNIYRRIKRREGHRTRNLVPSGKQAAYKPSRTKSWL